MIKLFVVDDHPVVASGLVEVLSRMDGVKSVGLASTVEDAVRLIPDRSPDVVVSDVMFGDKPDGFRLAQELSGAGADVPLLFYSSYDLPWFLMRAIDVGASGYILKTDSERDLRDAIHQVARGRPAFPAEALRALRLRASTTLDRGTRPPSARELEIITLTGTGFSNAEIATRLGIGQKTVETHIARLFARYGVRNRTVLVTFALGRGWLRLDREGVLQSMR